MSVGPPYFRAEMYAGRVTCRMPLVSNVEYVPRALLMQGYRNQGRAPKARIARIVGCELHRRELLGSDLRL